MKRSLITSLFVGGTVLALAVPAAAASPHFVRASASLNGADLVVSFKEAGLGDNQNVHYVASAEAGATYVCVNRGGANPSAANKTTVNGPVSASGTFSSGKNGTVSAALRLHPPSAGGFDCPNGQALRLARAGYTGVSIADTTNGVSRAISGTFTTGCLLPGVRGTC